MDVSVLLLGLRQMNLCVRLAVFVEEELQLGFMYL